MVLVFPGDSAANLALIPHLHFPIKLLQSRHLLGQSVSSVTELPDYSRELSYMVTWNWAPRATRE